MLRVSLLVATFLVTSPLARADEPSGSRVVDLLELRLVPLDAGCAKADDMRKLNECRARCRKDADTSRARCTETVKSCVKACTNAACRTKCTTANKTCTTSHQSTEKTCKAGCYNGTSCKHIPNTPD